jgi:hypothetical protein
MRFSELKCVDSEIGSKVCYSTKFILYQKNEMINLMNYSMTLINQISLIFYLISLLPFNIFYVSENFIRF